MNFSESARIEWKERAELSESASKEKDETIATLRAEIVELKEKK